MAHRKRGPTADRSSINFCSFLISCVILFLAAQAATTENGDNFLVHLDKIGKNLDKALSTAINIEQPNYTDIFINGSYVCNPRYNPRGLGELYNITKVFMKTILRSPVPEESIVIEDNKATFAPHGHWADLVLRYGFMIVICLLVLFLGAVLPLCGLFFCCCRCCGKCGGRSKLYDQKHDQCRRFYLGTLLIVCGTLLVFGVVCSLVTNARLSDGIENLSDNLNKSVEDSKTFLNNTNVQIETLLKTNFNEFYVTISKILNDCSTIVFNELRQMSNATSINEITGIAKQFPSIRSDYGLLKNATNDLRTYASQLNDAVRRVKRDLLDILKDCTGVIDQCTTLNNDISKLQTNVDFDMLPDINAQIKELDDILENANVEDILKGEQKLKKIQNDIKSGVQVNTEKAKEKIREAGVAIAKRSDEISKWIQNNRRFLTRMQHGDEHWDTIFNHLSNYTVYIEPYRQYSALSCCVVLLAVTTFIVLGLICGICGKRPGGYGDDCCNKGSGSQCLLCAVILMFFGAALIAASTLCYFLLGTVTEETICESLRNPRGSDLFKLADKFNLSDVGIHKKVSVMIDACHANRSIYDVLDVKTRFDIDTIYSYIDDFDIGQVLTALDRKTAEIDFDRVELLTPKQLRTLDRISKSDFANVDFGKFLDELSANFTSVDLKVITDELEAAIEKVKEISETDQRAVKLERGLESVLAQLSFYERNVVTPMQTTAEKVRVTAASLEKKLHLGHNSFKEGMESLIVNVQHAQESLKTQGPKMIKNAAQDLAKKIIDQCRKYMDRIVYKTKYEVGNCAPVSAAYNATVVSLCDKVVLQMNGFWFTLLCTLLVFIPTIIISIKLSILYQKQIPFSDYYVETGRGGKDKRKKKAKRRDDRPQMAGRGPNVDGAAREMAGASAHQDTRYTDMAPKTWEEFPAGGPPQYQRAPTEYERPPPYYYPGTATEQP